MPIARIQMPDGRIARIEVPEGTTPEQAQRLAQSVVPMQAARADLERQIASLPPEAQRIGRERFAADPRIRALEDQTRAARPAPKAPARQRGTGIAPLDFVADNFNEALIGIPQGLENIGAAITDPLVGLVYGNNTVDALRQKRQGRYDAASRLLSTQERPVARMTGQIGGTIPLAAARAPAIAGKFAPVATRAIQGAIGGAAVRDSNSDAAPSVAVGTAANVLLPPALSWAANTTLGRKITDGTARLAAPAINKAGELADNAAEGVLRLGSNAVGLPYKAPSAAAPSLIAPRAPVAPPPVAELGRAERVRLERLRRSGVSEPTTGMVTRNPNAWTFEQETAKRYGDVGAPIQQSLLTADQQLGARARELVRNQGGTIGREEVGQRVIDAAKARNKALSDEVSALYTRARENFGDQRVTNLASLRDLPNNPDWADNAVYDDMLAQLNKRLAKYADADGGATGLTVSQAEELRKFVSNLGPDNPQTFAIRRTIQNAIDTDVLDNVGGAPFAQARAAAAARFDEFGQTLPGRLVNDAIPPERVGQRVLGDGVTLEDMRDLRTTLQAAPGGEDALQAMNAQMVEDTLRPALNPEGGVAGATVLQNFQKNAPRLRTVLAPEQYKNLRRFALAARDARAAVPNSNVNYSNTASAYSNYFAPVAAPDRGVVGNVVANYGPRAVGAGLGGLFGLVAGNPTVGAGAGLGATMALQEMAERRATDALSRRMAEQVMAARNPQMAAQLASVNQWQAQQDALIAAERDGLTALLGSNPVIGGAASGGIFGQRKQR